MTGADSDALDRLARQMNQAADTLERSSSRISAALGSSPWRGADAQGFRAQWNSTDRRLLSECARALREAAADLQRNSAEQRQASGSDGGGGAMGGITGAPGFGMGGGPGFGPGGMPDASWAPGLGILLSLPGKMGQWWRQSDVSQATTLAGISLQALAFMSAHKAVVGDYTDRWHSVLDWGVKKGYPRDFLRFKKSEFLQFMHPRLHPFSKILNSADSALGRATPIFNALNLAGHAQEIGESVAQDGGFGYRSAVATSETVADALKMSKNPTSYLGGVALQSWTEAAKAFKMNVDSGNFSGGAMRDMVTHLPNMGWRDWGQVAADTGKSLVNPLLRIFT